MARIWEIENATLKRLRRESWKEGSCCIIYSLHDKCWYSMNYGHDNMTKIDYRNPSALDEIVNASDWVEFKGRRRAVLTRYLAKTRQGDYYLTNYEEKLGKYNDRIIIRPHDSIEVEVDNE